MLNNQIQNAGTWLAEELWNKASVPISKRNQQAFELNKEKTDPEVTAALRKHKIVYYELNKDLSRVYAQSAETAARVQKAMIIVQELAVKVGNLGDADEAAHNAVDSLKQSLTIAAKTLTCRMNNVKTGLPRYNRLKNKLINHALIRKP